VYDLGGGTLNFGLEINPTDEGEHLSGLSTNAIRISAATTSTTVAASSTKNLQTDEIDFSSREIAQELRKALIAIKHEL